MAKKFQEIPELIDEATEIMTQIQHRHKVEPLARQHIERALAHMREAWIAQDGQKARTLPELAKDCGQGEALLAAVEAGATEVKLGDTTFHVHPPEEIPLR